MPTASIHSSSDHFQTLLTAARPFLRDELEKVDEKLPSLVAVLKSVGAGECWHKHGSFLSHLIDIYKILKLWKAPDPVCLCGLFHSAYSNSYVNLAIFDPNTARNTVQELVGIDSERLIHLFCIVPRQPLIHDDLLFKYPDDSELINHLKQSQISIKNHTYDRNEPWRKKLNSILPAEGIMVKHIKTGEEIRVSRRVVATFLMMTIADFSDQWFGFQDALFENSNGRLDFSGNWAQSTLWPGDGKPGLWLNSLSRMAAIYNLIVREEHIYITERGLSVSESDRDEEIELVIPPVFENCSEVLSADDQIASRDLYWEAVCGGGDLKLEKVEEMLVRSVEKNGFVGEPRIVLAQVYLGQGRFEEGLVSAEEGLRLLLEWGSPWDKRMTWEGWIAWGRVLVMKAKEKSWPENAWGILNLGLVK